MQAVDIELTRKTFYIAVATINLCQQESMRVVLSHNNLYSTNKKGMKTDSKMIILLCTLYMQKKVNFHYLITRLDLLVQCVLPLPYQ